MKLRSPAIAAIALVGSIVLACGSESNGNSDFDGSSSSSGSSGPSSSSGFGTSSGASGDGGSSGDGGNCFAPVDMYIMFDRSGSMGQDGAIGSGGNSKWVRSITALSGYLNSAASKDQSAAIQFFPVQNHQDNPMCTTGSTYDTPAISGTGGYTTLPSNSFDALLNSTSPSQAGGSGTPTEGAIRGLTKYTAANRRPGHVTIGILITDGDPNGCNEVLKDLSDLLAAHYAATKVRTYVIGMTGATFDNLETIAKGGGAPTHPATVGAATGLCGTGQGAVAAPCTFWNVGDGDPTVFTAALAAIQESADGCKPGGGTINPPN